MYALSPGGEYVVPLGYYPSAMECGNELLNEEWDTSGGWSFHCHETEERSNPMRPVMRPESLKTPQDQP